MRIKIIGILVVILGSSTSCMMMAPMHTTSSMHDDHHNHQQSSVYHDLVCGTEIDANHAVTYNHMGTTYYFDTNECSVVFQKNPERFIENQPVNRNRNNNKLRSVAAITGGSFFMLVMMTLMIF